MRIVRFGPKGQERPGLMLEETTILDLGDHIDDIDQDFWRAGGVGQISDIVSNRAASLERFQLDDVRLGPPIAKPYQVLCIGLNYTDHATESGMEIPKEPILFNKAPRTVVGPNDDVVLPVGGEKTDWEVELAVIIGREAKYLADEQSARKCIGGYAISNDVSERAFQLERGGQWVKGKSCDTFNPLGPWLVTPDEIDDVSSLRMGLSLNGQQVQRGSTSDMIFGVFHIVWYVSQFLVLEPGDVINTGTPAGVGIGMNPPTYLKVGDRMELEISGLGRQSQMVRDSDFERR